MRNICVITILFVLTVTSACGRKKQEGFEIIPPGTFKTRAEAQNLADRENTNQAAVRADEKSKGVAEKALPCGKYVVVSVRNRDGREFWGTRLDTAGCPDQVPAFNFPTQPSTKGGTKP